MAKRNKKKRSRGTRLITVLFLGMAGYFLWHYYTLNHLNGFNLPIVQNRPPHYHYFGIDVSHHQGEINWDTLFTHHEYDSLVSFVYYKVSEGEFHVDRLWQRNREDLKRLGKPSGAYHFFLPKKDPLKQAANFLKHYTYRKGDCRPVLDVETDCPSQQELMNGMRTWLNEVERKTGVRPIIYTSRHFYEEKFRNAFQDYDFWIASYSRMPELQNDQRISIWQYSEEGILPGMEERVDLNVADAVPF